jgi:hypothetical protein
MVEYRAAVTTNQEGRVVGVLEVDVLHDQPPWICLAKGDETPREPLMGAGAIGPSPTARFAL